MWTLLQHRLRHGMAAWMMVGLWATLLAGCHAQPVRPALAPLPSAPPPAAIASNSISVHELAGRLGFTVAESGPYAAKLQSGNNTLRVLSEPNGGVYLNGLLILHAPGITSRQGEIFIPSECEARIRQALPSPPAVAPVPPVVKLPQRAPVLRGTVVIDAGHGGKDPGTHAKSGLVEKSVTLAVALEAARDLEAHGIKVQLTRDSDVFVELENRAGLANTSRADLFVSIHADWNPSAWKRGHSVLLPQSGDPKASLAARCLSQQLAAAGSSCHIIRMDDRGLVVLKRTTCPAVLVELGFLSNSADVRVLSDPANQSRLGQALADGVMDFLRSER